MPAKGKWYVIANAAIPESVPELAEPALIGLQKFIETRLHDVGQKARVCGRIYGVTLQQSFEGVLEPEGRRGVGANGVHQFVCGLVLGFHRRFDHRQATAMMMIVTTITVGVLM
jgi:hypothetical protein